MKHLINYYEDNEIIDINSKVIEGIHFMYNKIDNILINFMSVWKYQ